MPKKRNNPVKQARKQRRAKRQGAKAAEGMTYADDYDRMVMTHANQRQKIGYGKYLRRRNFKSPEPPVGF